MTSMLLLGVAPDDATLPGDIPSLNAVPDLKGIFAEVDAAAGGTPEGIADWARMQNDLLCRIAADTDVLPVRLGAIFSSRAALRSHLAEQGPRLKSALNALAGSCQYDLCADRADPARRSPPEPPRTGSAFLTDRRLRRDARRTRSTEVDRLLRNLAEGADALSLDVWAHVRPPEGRLLWRSLLVARQDVPALTAALARSAMPADALGLKISLTGPMPPFAFSHRSEPCHA